MKCRVRETGGVKSMSRPLLLLLPELAHVHSKSIRALYYGGPLRFVRFRSSSLAMT